MIRNFFLLSILSISMISACDAPASEKSLRLGAEQFEKYLPLMEGKSVGLLINHTSMVGGVHLVDYLLGKEVNVKKIFAPEHGFRGVADAGEEIKDNVDEKTGIPVASLYGKTKKPTAEMMQDLDVVVFDIQDVGVRFYTYISTMHYMMEACVENGVKMVVFDRPNPNGHVIDGPILDPQYRSFVGMHPIPVAHGLTVGELAKMINGEKWLEGGKKCDLTVITMENYSHSLAYSLPIKPSPNLPNDQAVRLYPSLCFFEGTQMSVGRGTQFPFQVVGYPDQRFGSFSFTPESIEGMAKHPKLEGRQCFGIDLREASTPDHLDIQHIIDLYSKWDKDEAFFTSYFNTLAGTDQLKSQIMDGLSAEEIRASWANGLADYKKLREKYRMYPE